MTASHNPEVQALKDQIIEQKKEIAHLKAQVGDGAAAGLSNEAVDGIIFVVVMIAVVTGVVIWLSSMPS